MRDSERRERVEKKRGTREKIKEEENESCPRGIRMQ